MIKKDELLRKIVKLSGFTLLIIAALLVGVSIIGKIDFVRQRYDEYYVWLHDFRLRVTTLENKWLIVVIIESLFLMKSMLPVVPLSFMFIVSGVVFSLPQAILIDISGMIILLSVRYYSGYYRGGGRSLRVVQKNPTVKKLLERDGEGNPWLLFVFRLVPSVPINKVSDIYGAIKYKYWKYIGISMAGFFPRLISYIIVGNNVFDPFSMAFTTPLIAVFLISGASMLVVNEVLEYIYEKNKNKD